MTARNRPRCRRLAALCALLTALTLGAIGLNLTFGPRPLSLGQIGAVMTGNSAHPDDQLVVLGIRLPRTVLALMVGSSLAVAGGVMQGVTRNPLASPSIAGLTSGGTLGMLLCVLWLPELGHFGLLLSSLAGSMIAVSLVYAIAANARSGMTPERLALAGIMVSVLLGSISGMLVFEYGLATASLYWQLGGIMSLGWSEILVLLPVFAIGMAVALVLSPQITVLNLGTNVARGLGQRTGPVILAAMLSVLLLAGTAVSIAGPVAFVGLFVPHVVRVIGGHDYRWVLPVSALAGALFVLVADLLTRSLGGGLLEVPLGLFTTLVGLPFFVVLARSAAQRTNLS
ncbi:MAG: iron ABC transporter permease [Planctomycetota bacterium]